MPPQPAEIVQKVRTDFVFDPAKTVVPGLRRVDKQVKKTHFSMRKLLNTMKQFALSFKGLAIGGIGFGAGLFLRSITRAAVQFSNMELSTQVILRNITKAQGKSLSFGQTQGMSKTVIGKLRKEAISTPGTFEQTMESFQRVAQEVTGSGGSINDAIALASNVASADAIGGTTGVVATDVRQLLQGTSGRIQTPQLRAIKKQTVALVRLGKKMEALALVTDALQTTEAEREAFAASPGGKLSTFDSQITQLMVSAGVPFVEGLSKGLESLLEDGESLTETFAGLGVFFGEVVRWGLELLSWWKQMLAVGVAWKALKWGKALRKWYLDASLAKSGLKMLASGLTALAGPLAVIIAALGSSVFLLSEAADEIERKKFDDPVGYFKKNAGTSGALGVGLQFTNPKKYAAGLARAEAQAAVNARIKSDPLGSFNKMMSFIGMKPLTFPPEAVGLDDRIGQGGGVIPDKAKINVDMRGARINVTQKLDTKDPVQVASAALMGGFKSIVGKRLSATIGMGGAPSIRLR